MKVAYLLTAKNHLVIGLLLPSKILYHFLSPIKTHKINNTTLPNTKMQFKFQGTIRMLKMSFANKYNWDSTRSDTLYQLKKQITSCKCTTTQAVEIKTTEVYIGKLLGAARVKSRDI